MIKPSTRHRLVLGVILTVGVVSTLFAGLNALSLTIPAQSVPLAPPLSQVHDTRADLAANAARPDIERAMIESRFALQQSPMDAGAWLRIAYLRHLRTGRFDAETVSAVDRSYALAPYGGAFGHWRMRFLFENWSSVPPGLRAQAMDELQVVARHRGDPRLSIVDPSGRLAARLIVRLGLDQAEASKSTDNPG